MFDSIAPTELLVVAIVALVIIGPKDLPRAMRFVGNWMAKARAMARHFRSGFDAMMRESELEDLEKQWRAHNQAIMTAYPDVVNAVVEPPTKGPGAVAEPQAMADGAPQPAQQLTLDMPPAGSSPTPPPGKTA